MLAGGLKIGTLRMLVELLQNMLNHDLIIL